MFIISNMYYLLVYVCTPFNLVCIIGTTFSVFDQQQLRRNTNKQGEGMQQCIDRFSSDLFWCYYIIIVRIKVFACYTTLFPKAYIICACVLIKFLSLSVASTDAALVGVEEDNPYNYAEKYEYYQETRSLDSSVPHIKRDVQQNTSPLN